MLARIEARDFRCFGHVAAEFHPETTLLVGRNAQGKTSVLEAVCMLLRLQSPRTSVRSQIIREGAKSCMVEGLWSGNVLRHGLSLVQRRLAVDGAVCGSGQDYLAHSGVVVWMDHSDMNLLRGGAECRRRYLDFTGSQTSAEYYEALRKYDRALRSRNYVLKREATVNWRQAEAYAVVMESSAEVIWRVREDIVRSIAGPTTAALGKLSSGQEAVELTLLRGCESDKLSEALLAARDLEAKSRTTAAGPHRDNLQILINGREAGAFASEGQQRSISVALKLAQASVLEDRRGVPPLLLLDDVFGELDDARRQAVLENLPIGSQRVITTTGGGWTSSLGPGLVYQVEQGTLKGHKI